MPAREERKTKHKHSISQTKQTQQSKNTRMFTMTNTCTGTSLRWQQQPHHPPFNRRHRQPVTVSFKNNNNNNKPNDMDRVLKEAWQNANDGFERFLFEAKKTAERIDRQYSVSKRFASVASAAADRAREIDRDFEIGVKYRNFSSDFALNWPRVCYFLHFFFILFIFVFWDNNINLIFCWFFIFCSIGCRLVNFWIAQLEKALRLVFIFSCSSFDVFLFLFIPFCIVCLWIGYVMKSGLVVR